MIEHSAQDTPPQAFFRRELGAPPNTLRGRLAAALERCERLEDALRESEARYRTLLALEQQERAQAEAAESNLRSVLDASPQPIIVLDLEGYVKSWNAAAERTLGWSADEIVDRPLPTIPPVDSDAANAVFLRLIGGETILDMEVRRQRKDGSDIDLSISAAPLHDAAGRITSIVEVCADITQRKQAERLLKYLAFHDHLTDLPNRTLLKERIEQAILASTSGAPPFALLLIDLDRFKEVNDSLGHHYGDELLKEVAARLRQVTRVNDTVARLGGDEFAILLTGADADATASVAHKILGTLREPFVLRSEQFMIATSIGAAFYPEHGRDARALLRKADQAMYVAKRARKGYVGFTP